MSVAQITRTKETWKTSVLEEWRQGRSGPDPVSGSGSSWLPNFRRTFLFKDGSLI